MNGVSGRDDNVWSTVREYTTGGSSPIERGLFSCSSTLISITSIALIIIAAIAYFGGPIPGVAVAVTAIGVGGAHIVASFLGNPLKRAPMILTALLFSATLITLSALYLGGILTIHQLCLGILTMYAISFFGSCIILSVCSYLSSSVAVGCAARGGCDDL